MLKTGPFGLPPTLVQAALARVDLEAYEAPGLWVDGFDSVVDSEATMMDTRKERWFITKLLYTVFICIYSLFMMYFYDFSF